MSARRAAAAALQSHRRFASQPAVHGEVLQRWLQGWECSRPVPPPGADPDAPVAPSALAWLRRRGPVLPEAVIHRIFRDEAVRVWDPATAQVRRVAKDAELPPGARLLLPKALIAEQAAARQDYRQQQGRREPRGGSGSGARPGRPARDDRGPPAPGGRPAAAGRADAGAGAADPDADAVAALRRALLLDAPQFVAVDKPAGLAAQGGAGVRQSVDSLMQDAFSREAAAAGEPLRLAHRLDRQATGVLLLAKTASAASWLGEAFQSGAAGLRAGGAGRGRGRGAGGAGGASVDKTYWAVVCRGGGKGGAPRPLPASGTITDAVGGGEGEEGGGGGGGGGALAAETRFKVLAEGGGLAWVQLRPVTGRKHQLRLHCARSLGAPILGDSRYGAVRAAPQRDALEQLRRGGGWSGGGGGGDPPLLLHCRSMVVRAPGAALVRVTAPLPPPWVALFKLRGWALPRDHKRPGQAPAPRQPSLKRLAG
jgi:23S rRNA pseudouridine955/2504/2580 synthase